jgi:hypothetical protein
MLVVLISVAGCSGHPKAPGHTGAARTPANGTHPPAGGTPSRPAGAKPFDLYTHCGIDEANVDDAWYEATTPLNAGGNPPASWSNPYQPGWIQRVNATTVVFSDTKGHHVEFALRPGATGPKRICS